MGILDRFTPTALTFQEARIFRDPETGELLASLSLAVLNVDGERVESVSLQEVAPDALKNALKTLFEDKTDAIKLAEGIDIIPLP